MGRTVGFEHSFYFTFFMPLKKKKKKGTGTELPRLIFMRIPDYMNMQIENSHTPTSAHPFPY